MARMVQWGLHRPTLALWISSITKGNNRLWSQNRSLPIAHVSPLSTRGKKSAHVLSVTFWSRLSVAGFGNPKLIIKHIPNPILTLQEQSLNLGPRQFPPALLKGRDGKSQIARQIHQDTTDRGKKETHEDSGPNPVFLQMPK